MHFLIVCKNCETALGYMIDAIPKAEIFCLGCTDQYEEFYKLLGRDLTMDKRPENFEKKFKARALKRFNFGINFEELKLMFEETEDDHGQSKD